MHGKRTRFFAFSQFPPLFCSLSGRVQKESPEQTMHPICIQQYTSLEGLSDLITAAKLAKTGEQCGVLKESSHLRVRGEKRRKRNHCLVTKRGKFFVAVINCFSFYGANQREKTRHLKLLLPSIFAPPRDRLSKVNFLSRLVIRQILILL